MDLKTIVVLISIIGVAGCATTNGGHSDKDVQNQVRLYQLYINEDGKLLDPVTSNVISYEDKYIENIYKNFRKILKDKPDLK